MIQRFLGRNMYSLIALAFAGTLLSNEDTFVSFVFGTANDALKAYDLNRTGEKDICGKMMRRREIPRRRNEGLKLGESTLTFMGSGWFHGGGDDSMSNGGRLIILRNRRLSGELDNRYVAGIRVRLIVHAIIRSVRRKKSIKSFISVPYGGSYLSDVKTSTRRRFIFPVESISIILTINGQPRIQSSSIRARKRRKRNDIQPHDRRKWGEWL